MIYGAPQARGGSPDSELDLDMGKTLNLIFKFVLYLGIVWVGFMLRWTMERSSNKVVNDKNSINKLVEDQQLTSTKVSETELRRVVDQPAAYNTYSLCFRRMNGRSDLSLLMNDLQLIGEGVEIGVKDGEFADYTLSKWQGRKLHLVDPWLEQNSALYNDISNSPQNEQDRRFASVSKLMEEKYPGRYQIHRNLSTDAAKDFNDLSLDYIYIDAR